MGSSKVPGLWYEREERIYPAHRNYERRISLDHPWYWVDHTLLSIKVPVQRRFATNKLQGDFLNSTPYRGIIYRPHGAKEQYQTNVINTSSTSRHLNDVVVSAPLPTGEIDNVVSDDIPGLSASIFWSDNSRNRAEAEALVKLADRKLDVGMAAIELRETSSYIVQNVSRYSKALLHLKRGNPSGFIKELRSYRKRFSSSSRRDWSDFERNARRQSHFSTGELSSRVLEFNYAIMPLMNDIYGAVELFNEGISVRSGPVVSAVRNLSVKENQNNVRGGPYYTASVKTDSVYRVRLTASVNNAHWSALQMLGLGNPAELAWAAVPFSFLVDWGLPISTWLAALSAPCGLDFVRGSFSVKHNSEFTWLYDGPGEADTCRASMRCYHREPYNTFPVPMPYVKNPFSGSHVVSALALLRQIF